MTHTRICNGLKVDRRKVFLIQFRSANFDPGDLNWIERPQKKVTNKQKP